MERLDILLQELDQFNKDRDWDQFHSNVNLAKSISIEANELLECYQWSDVASDEEHVKEELADVLNYCMQFCINNGYDLVDIVREKMEKNALKYPVEKCKGSMEKYTQLRSHHGKTSD